MKKTSAYSFSEEVVNTSTHGLGLAMSLTVCILFLVHSTAIGTWVAPLSFALYLFGPNVLPLAATSHTPCT